ncbi:hypothetical protein [Sulfurimonas sp.]|uniref:hypothetical protein n=1 Tax=Sulfurimonas sp. TaxID=2022749 RepID=UPI0025E0634F|nr:hypothetical protein [Sulfurimonas sp.]
MSLFSKTELYAFLEDANQGALAAGLNQTQAQKITRKAFKNWLSDYTSVLKEQIKATNALNPKDKDTRVKRQLNDFHFFRQTYFPHYYTLAGKSLLQEDLENTYFKIADKKKLQGLKFAKAAPRGNGKSTDASRVFPIWCIVNDFKKFITMFSDAIELSEILIESIKAELEENARLKADFPHATNIGKVWKIGEIVTRNNIRLKGYGSSKRVRGVFHGAFRPDLTIIDDLENDTNVRSRKQRDKLEDWLDEAIDNLGSVDGSMDILYIGTILHRDSVLSRKLKLKFWNPVVFRSLISYPTNIDMWDEYGDIYRYNGLDEAHNFYLENKKKMDEGAVLLWDAIKLELLMQKRASNAKAFQKEQQNNPNSENQKFDSSKFIKITHTQMPKLDKIFLYVDAKGDSVVGDFCGFIGAGLCNATQKLYVFYSNMKRIKGKPVVTETIRLLKTMKVYLLSGDKNGGFYMLRDWIKDEAFRQGVPMPSTKFIHHTDNKEDRMGELEFPCDEGDIIFVGDHHDLFAQMDDFPEADHDDLHDPLSAIYRLSKLRRLKKDAKSGGRRTNVRHQRPRRNRATRSRR